MNTINASTSRDATGVFGTRRLESGHAFQWRSLVDIWRYRELLYFLVWRDIKVRYKQTALGASWAIVQPVMSMVVFTVFFGGFAKMPSDNQPYPLFSLCALVPWTYFSTAVAAGAASLIGQQHVLSKVYFPRLLVPVAAVIAPLVDFGIAFVVLLVTMAAYRVVPGAAVLWLPLLLILAIATAGAAALWLSALTVRFRDVRYIIPFLLQIWMFASPVVYPASIVPEKWRVLVALNPMAAVVGGFRWALVGGPAPGASSLLSIAIVSAALVSGLFYFRRVEGTLVDIL